MAGAGAWGGAWLAAHAAAWDHWIAFALLTAIGANMLRGDDDDDDTPAAALPLGTLLALAVATSVDALAAGVSLPLLGPSLLVSLGVIGLGTVGIAGAGAWAGRRAGAHLGAWVERAGGLALWVIALRILLEHTGWLGA
jgi:putative Mn2+ efflux pump MntP